MKREIKFTGDIIFVNAGEKRGESLPSLILDWRSDG
jgi:hypothetical protein